MTATYRAMQVSRPGVLELVERAIPRPAEGQVLIQVEACGLCGADAATIESADAGRPVARVPGHEVVGRVVALGAGTPTRWQLGQRVGVGRLGGHCQVCDPCCRGLFNLCLDQPVVGSTQDGGYAERLLVRHTALVAIRDELDAVEAAPLLCAGLATFNALKKSGAQAGDLVAVQGIGGLGHLALQYARRMGFRVVAIGRGEAVAQDAPALGAHVTLDAEHDDVVARLNAMGGARVILTTITDGAAAARLFGGLAPQGRLMVLGVGKDGLQIPAGALVAGERRVEGSMTGTPHDSARTLDFSVLADVRPRVETMPLADAAEAYRRMRSGAARYRMVLTMDVR